MIKVLIQYEIYRYTLECLDLGIFDVGKTLNELMKSFEEALLLLNTIKQTNYELKDFLFNIKNLKRNKSKK